jgi:hypothetical protein
MKPGEELLVVDDEEALRETVADLAHDHVAALRGDVVGGRGTAETVV